MARNLEQGASNGNSAPQRSRKGSGVQAVANATSSGGARSQPSTKVGASGLVPQGARGGGVAKGLAAGSLRGSTRGR